MPKILLIGARGQLGADICRENSRHEIVGLDRAALDVTNVADVREAVKGHRPDVVVNSTAYNLVDKAEREPEAALEVNARAPRNLALAAHEAGALFVHFSTDFVFGGPERTPRSEDDVPYPTSVYASSKLLGEHLVAAATPLQMTIRTCGLYGLHGQGGKGGNFVETMLRLGAGRNEVRVVADQTLTPTATVDVARKTLELVDRWLDSRDEALLGLCHVTNGGEVTWQGFAEKIFELAGLRARAVPISTADFGAPAPRPAYSVLRHDRLNELGMDDLPGWQDALTGYLGQRSRQG